MQCLHKTSAMISVKKFNKYDKKYLKVDDRQFLMGGTYGKNNFGRWK